MLKFVKKINSPFIIDICLSKLLVCRIDCKVSWKNMNFFLNSTKIKKHVECNLIIKLILIISLVFSAISEYF